MRKGFFDRVYSVIHNSDILIEVVDARFADKTRNKKIEEYIKRKGKELIIVLNKADLISKNTAKKTKKEIKETCIFISSTEKQGMTRLRELIAIKIKKAGNTIGVIGYPNTGKSSIINSLTKKKIKTSITAGFTRGEQIVKGRNFKLIDSPGIIPYGERDEIELVLIGAKNPSKLKYPEEAAEKLIKLLQEKNPKELEKLGAKSNEPENILEEIALKRKKLMKKGLPNINAVSKQLLLEFQKGKIKI